MRKEENQERRFSKNVKERKFKIEQCAKLQPIFEGLYEVNTEHDSEDTNIDQMRSI